MDWLRDIEGLGRVKEITSSPTPTLDEAGPDMTSSVAKSAARQRDERAMKEQLANFMKEQKRLEEEEGDGDYSKEDRQRDEDAFKADQEASEQARPATIPELQKQINELKVLLEGQQRLVPEGGKDKEVLQVSGSRILWGNLAGLLFKVPDGAVSEMYLALKGVDCPSLDTDAATLIVETEAGAPLWYVQFDYLRGVETPGA